MGAAAILRCEIIANVPVQFSSSPIRVVTAQVVPVLLCEQTRAIVDTQPLIVAAAYEADANLEELAVAQPLEGGGGEEGGGDGFAERELWAGGGFHNE